MDKSSFSLSSKSEWTELNVSYLYKIESESLLFVVVLLFILLLFILLLFLFLFFLNILLPSLSLLLLFLIINFVCPAFPPCSRNLYVIGIDTILLLTILNK